MFMGELFENGFFPRLAARDLRRWIELLKHAETWDVGIYIPGHGAPGGKKEVASFRGYLEWLAAQMERRVKEGQTLEQVKKELQPAEVFHYRAPELATENVEAAYNQFAVTTPSLAPPAASQ